MWGQWGKQWWTLAEPPNPTFLKIYRSILSASLPRPRKLLFHELLHAAFTHLPHSPHTHTHTQGSITSDRKPSALPAPALLVSTLLPVFASVHKAVLPPRCYPWSLSVACSESHQGSSREKTRVYILFCLYVGKETFHLRWTWIKMYSPLP
jgi:hypothetical protein